MYDTPHGVANAIFLPIVFEYNIEADVRRHRDVAEALGICPCEKSAREVAEDGARWLASISKELNIPKLKELGYVEPKNFEALAELCMKNVSLPSQRPGAEQNRLYKSLRKGLRNVTGGNV